MRWDKSFVEAAARGLAVTVALAAGAIGTTTAVADQPGPFAAPANFSPSADVATALFGSDGAFSADGSTAIISDQIGRAWIYTRAGSAWTQQAELYGTALGPLKVAISADGNTALLGGTGASHGLLVETRSGSTWTQQQIPTSQPVSTESVSADGNTILTAGTTPTSPVVYSRSGGTWTATQLPTTGWTVCCTAATLSGDGNTAVVGGWNGSPDLTAGTFEVFVRNGSSWTVQQTLSFPADESEQTGFASYTDNASLSSDGNTLALGGLSSGPVGVAWIYSRSGSTWSDAQTISPSNPSVRPGRTGASATVSLSGDGNTALVGGATASGGPAVLVYARTDSGWSQEQQLVPTPGSPSANDSSDFGIAVSLSSDGSTAFVGDPNNNQAWIFGNQSQTMSTTPTSTTKSPAPSKMRTVSMTVGGYKVTLTIPDGTVAGSLKGSFAAKPTRSKALRFVSAALYLDKSVKHATLKRSSAPFTLSLKEFKRGSHTLKLVVSFAEKAGRKTKLVSKTLSTRVMVG